MGDDNNGECVAHGKNQAFVGLNLQGILDLVGNTAVNGDELHEAFSAAANAGGGWVDYHWANKVGDDPFLKIARIAGVHKFGTSYYLGVGFNHEMREYAYSPGCESAVAFAAAAFVAAAARSQLIRLAARARAGAARAKAATPGFRMRALSPTRSTSSRTRRPRCCATSTRRRSSETLRTRASSS